MVDEKIMEALKKVMDPELGVSIVDLGFIYETKLEKKKAHVKMTLSTPMCPLSSSIIADVTSKLKDAGFESDVELTFEPMWTPDMMSEDLKKRINASK